MIHLFIKFDKGRGKYEKILAISLLIVSIFFAGCSDDFSSVASSGDSSATEVVSNEYYILVNEDYDTYENGQYIYSLDGYNKVGEVENITFQSVETLDLQSIVKVEIKDDKSTSNPITINIDDVPDVAKEKLLLD